MRYEDALRMRAALLYAAAIGCAGTCAVLTRGVLLPWLQGSVGVRSPAGRESMRESSLRRFGSSAS